MSSVSPNVTPVVQALGARLTAEADEQTRAWWERYLKGALPFRGVPMARIRAVVHAIWRDEGLDQLPPAAQTELALRLLAEPFSEDKLAGVLVLAERLLDELSLDDVPRLAEPLARGDIDDWSTCDWYCVKVLGPFVAASDDRRAASEAIASWRFAERLWHRRAAAVSFVRLAPRAEAFYPGFSDLLLEISAVLVRDPARFSQTAVGWLLRELSVGAPAAVGAFVDAHRERMSREAFRAATAKLPSEKQVQAPSATARRTDGRGIKYVP